MFGWEFTEKHREKKNTWGIHVWLGRIVGKCIVFLYGKNLRSNVKLRSLDFITLFLNRCAGCEIGKLDVKIAIDEYIFNFYITMIDFALFM